MEKDVADKLIAGFAVERELEGGKGWVARDGSGRRVVLKGVPGDCLKGGGLRDGVRERLERFQQIPHSGVAHLLGVERDGAGGAWMVWEYVEGESLAEVLGRVPADRVYELMRDVVRAVDVLHMLGLVHGNVHERNAIVGESGTWLTDASPLLFTDPEDDVAAVKALLGRVFEARGLVEAAGAVRGAGSLRAMGAALDGTYVPWDDREARETPRFKRKTFGWAMAIVVLAVCGAAAVVWWWTRDTGRVVESRGGMRIGDCVLRIGQARSVIEDLSANPQSSICNPQRGGGVA